MLLRWRGTIMPAVLCRPVMWLLLASHVGFLYLHMYRQDIHMPAMPWKLTGARHPPDLFLGLLLGQLLHALLRLLLEVHGDVGRGDVLGRPLRVHFPKATPEKLWNLSRHIVASVYILYFQLAGGASDGGKQVTESEWQVLLQTGLISQEEKKKLAEYRGFKPFLLQVWALRSLTDHLSEDKEKGASANLNPFQQQALALRGHCADIVNTMTQPIPFPYYHTLTLMLSLNLLLIAYSMIEFETVMTIPCFFIIVLVCLGLKETAVALADPFGGDDVDFETEVYMANMLANTKVSSSSSTAAHRRAHHTHPPANHAHSTLSPSSLTGDDLAVGGLHAADAALAGAKPKAANGH